MTEESSEQITTLHEGDRASGPTVSEQEQAQALLERGPKLSKEQQEHFRKLKEEDDRKDEDIRKLEAIEKVEWQKAHDAGKDTSFPVINQAARREFQKKYGRPAVT